MISQLRFETDGAGDHVEIVLRLDVIGVGERVFRSEERSDIAARELPGGRSLVVTEHAHSPSRTSRRSNLAMEEGGPASVHVDHPGWNS